MTVEFHSVAKLPTEFGEFDIHVFTHHDQEHLALTIGDFTTNTPIMTRVHSECLTGDGLFSLRCDCGPQLKFAMQRISEAPAGLLIYLRQEGRGIGLLEKIKAYNLQDQGEDTFEANVKLGHDADGRNYEMLKAVFDHFKISQIDLLTNNPEKVKAIDSTGVKIINRQAIKVGLNPHNKDYIQTKIDKFSHWLD